MSPTSPILAFAAALAIGASAPALAPRAGAPTLAADGGSQLSLDQGGRVDVSAPGAIPATRVDCAAQPGLCSADQATYEHERDAYDARFGARAWERRYSYGDHHRRLHP